MPLLTQLRPGVAATTYHWLDVPSQLGESIHNVRHALVANLAMVDGDERGVFPCKESRLLEHGLKRHALVLAQEGEHHVEVDERLGLHGQFLNHDVEALTLAGEGLRQILDALAVGADALANAQSVGAGNLHVAALGAGIGVPRHSVEGVHAKEMAEYRLIDERLAFAHLKAHRVDEHAVIHRARCVASEEQVI